MNFVRCEHGHFFDQDANPDGCPFSDQLSAGEKNEEADLGTGEHVDVDLSPDLDVTQDGAQAALAFEPRNGRFSMFSMQVRELTYVNDELLDRGVELRKGDLVTLGGTTLVFVPLCDASFGWDSWPAR